jgi:ATP-dependent DNA helicase RecQ
LPYHAGMSNEDRAENQRRFLTEEACIIVATIAFGMGIDKPDVRFVVHLDLPKTLESYYQETGRAGRDGKKADALLIYSMGDMVFLRQMIEQSEGGEHFKRAQHQKLSAMLGFCEISECRRKALLGYFGEARDTDCGYCDTCQGEVETFDGTVAAQKALSCIYRTGQRFGAGYLIDILLGKENERILSFHHDQVSTFGIGQEYNAAEWRSIYRQLVAGGYVAVDPQSQGGFRLNESSMPVLKGEKHIRFKKDRTIKTNKGKSGVLKGAVTSMLDDEVLQEPGGRDLFLKLKEFRSKRASQRKVPPYVIFNDNTLLELASLKPQTDSALLGITGIGQKKMESYGKAILRIIRDHEKQDAGVAKPTPTSPRHEKSETKDPEQKKKKRASDWQTQWEPKSRETREFVRRKIKELGSAEAVDRHYAHPSLISSYARRIADAVLSGHDPD